MTLDLESLNTVLLVGAAVLMVAVLAVRASVGMGFPSLLIYLLIGVLIEPERCCLLHRWRSKLGDEGLEFLAVMKFGGDFHGMSLFSLSSEGAKRDISGRAIGPSGVKER